MTFARLADYFQKIEAITSRLEITGLLSDLFKEIDASEIDKVLYFLQGRLGPLYEKLDFGLGEKLVVTAAAQSFGEEKELFISLVSKKGDVGLAIEEAKRIHKDAKYKNITVTEVFTRLDEIARASGSGSQEKKLTLLARLIADVDPLSAKFIVRIPLNTMRLGFSDMTILDGLSWMITGDKSLRKDIEKAYHVLPDIGYIGKTMKEKGIEGLAHVKPKLFVPILMMKAERLSSGQEIIDKINEGLVESKYDGFRLQVHMKKDGKKTEVKMFTRGMEDATSMYPDVAEAVSRELDVDSVIIEGEAMGYNRQTGEFLPFQQTTQRKRKYGIEEKIQEIPLRLMVFELLYLNGESCLTKSLSERRSLLEKIIQKSSDNLMLSPATVISTPDDIEGQFDDAIGKGMEGIMVKKLGGEYKPGVRESNWIKYKRSYSSKINDTIDCVVMGYDTGKGKRTSFGIGAILIGVYDDDNQQFVTVAKIGTGFTDEEWRTMKKELDAITLDHKPPIYDSDNLTNPDVWVSPKVILEIKADEISRSAVHTAGRKMKVSKNGKAQTVDESGYALRFPRLERIRDDKRPEDATTVHEIKAMFEAQKK